MVNKLFICGSCTTGNLAGKQVIRPTGQRDPNPRPIEVAMAMETLRTHIVESRTIEFFGAKKIAEISKAIETLAPLARRGDGEVSDLLSEVGQKSAFEIVRRAASEFLSNSAQQ